MRIFFAILSIFFIVTIITCGSTKNKELNMNQSPKECIENIIEQDSELGNMRNHACEKQSLSATIDDYVASLDKLNYNNCPSEFTLAFEEHIEAWVNATEITDLYPDLRGEMHDVFAIIESGPDSTEFKYLVAEIWSTWEQVELAMNLE